MRDSHLNENQKRRVEIALFLLDRDLDEVMQLLKNEASSGILYAVEKDIDANVAARLVADANEIKVTIADLKTCFGLEPQVRLSSRTIRALLAASWVRIHDARPRNLGGMGAVDPTLFESLEPALVHLIEILQRMENLVESQDEQAGES